MQFYKYLFLQEIFRFLEGFRSLQCRVSVTPMPCFGHSNAVFRSLQCRFGHSNAVPWSLQCRALVTPMPCLGHSNAVPWLGLFGDVNLVRFVDTPSGDCVDFLNRFQGFLEIIPEAF
jgi:hypothetical protein